MGSSGDSSWSYRQKPLEEWAALFASADATVRLHALRQCESMGPSGLPLEPYLAARVADPELDVRIAAVRVVASIGDVQCEDLVSELIRRFRDDDRIAPLAATTLSRTERYAERLWPLLESDHEAERFWAERALRVEGEESLRFLEERFRGGVADVQLRVLNILMTGCREVPESLLLNLLDSACCPAVSLRVAFQLSRLGVKDSKLVARLVEELGDPRNPNLPWVLGALGRLGTTASFADPILNGLNALLARGRELDPDVAEAAKRIRRQLNGRDRW